MVGLVLVDDQLGLRRFESEIGIGEDEQTALLRIRLDLVEHFGHLGIVARRLDDEFDRHFARTDRNGRWRGGEGLDARNAGELALHFLDDHRIGALALVPGLDNEADESGVHRSQADDGEHVLPLRHIHEELSHPIAIGLQIVEIGVLGGIDEGEHDALVLGRRQLLVDRAIEYARHGDDDDDHQGEDRPLLQSTLEAARIEAAHRAENALDQALEPAFLLVLLEDLGAHHRRQRQRDEPRDDHRARQRKGEFAEQRAG